MFLFPALSGCIRIRASLSMSTHKYSLLEPNPEKDKSGQVRSILSGLGRQKKHLILRVQRHTAACGDTVAESLGTSFTRVHEICKGGGSEQPLAQSAESRLALFPEVLSFMQCRMQRYVFYCLLFNFALHLFSSHELQE